MEDEENTVKTCEAIDPTLLLEMEGVPNNEVPKNARRCLRGACCGLLVGLRGVGYKATGGETWPGGKSQDEEQKVSIPLPSFCPILDIKKVVSRPWQCW